MARPHGPIGAPIGPRVLIMQDPASPLFFVETGYQPTVSSIGGNMLFMPHAGPPLLGHDRFGQAGPDLTDRKNEGKTGMGLPLMLRMHLKGGPPVLQWQGAPQPDINTKAPPALAKIYKVTYTVPTPKNVG